MEAIFNKKKITGLLPVGRSMLIGLSGFLVAYVLCPSVPLFPRNAPDSPVNSIEEYRGRPYFEEAYQLEKVSPGQSVLLYEKALSLGLDDKMGRAAVWRLFYLYSDLKEYGKALTLLPRLGSSKGIARVAEKLQKDMAGEWKINDLALENYIQGVRVLQNGPGSDGKSAGEFFLSALSAAYGNNEFRMEILNRLIHAGRMEEALSVLDRNGVSSTEDRVMKADLLVSLKRYSDASAILKELAADNTFLDDGQKYRILYLLGRIERDAGDIERAVIYFRYAARYANEEERYRQIALAAFSLYRGGFKMQAAALMRSVPDVPDKNVRLLRLILGSEVDGNPEKINELVKMGETLDPSTQSPLEQRALQLIGKFRRREF